MHLVQILLPLYDTHGVAIDRTRFAAVRQELVDRFGGLTAYTRAPAKGLWDDGAKVEHDEIVVYEVMADDLQRQWWAAWRQELERRFAQQEIVVRALAIERL